MANPQSRIHTYLLIESHPAELGKNLEVKLDMKHTGAQPLRKVLEKTINLADGNQDYIITIYAGDIMGSFIKDKEIKYIDGIYRTFPVKIVLLHQKNKFESQINPSIDKDSFMPFVKYEIMKKFFGKDIDPPPQVQLNPINYIPLFSEALLLNLRKKVKDPIYLEFLRFSVEKIKELDVITCKLYLFVYEKILNSEDIDLLNSILEIFDLKKIENAKNIEEMNTFKEGFMLIYDNQENYINLIRRIPNVNFLSYLIKFYTVNIFYHYQYNDIPTIESIMAELRDKNPYDPLILPKMFLSEFNTFYRSLKLNLEIKLSLVSGYIQVSLTYENLLTAFSMISEYIKGDLNSIIMTINQNYEKINEICVRSNTSVKINNYIIQKKEDDLAKVQENLITLGQNKLNKGYTAISFNLDMWHYYFLDGKNKEFLEFLKSHLIQTSLNLKEIKEALIFIINYTRTNTVEMLELFVKNYDKLESICQNEDKHIDASNYLETSTKDNSDAIKENFDFILSKKLSSNYETITFPIKIWISYINFSFNNEFLLYIENKLLDDASSYENIIDCLTYATCLRKYKFVDILKFIIENFEKINNFAQLNAQHIDFSKFYKINKKDDDMESIYQLICQLIPLEINKNFRTFDFPIKIWEPYSDSKDLKYLRTIRKIIKKLYEMDSTLDEDSIKLPKKIHEVGYLYIKQGKLNDDELIEFIGIEESFYTNKVYDGFMDIEKGQIKQLNDQLNQLNNLDNEYNIITGRGEFCGQELQKIIAENNSFVTKINSLQNALSDLMRRVNSCENDTQTLKFRFQNNI